MLNSKYKKPLTIFLFYAITIIILSVIGILARTGSSEMEDLSPLIPFDDIPLEIIMMMVVIIPLVSLLGAMIFGFVLSPIFVLLHYSTKKNNNAFGIDIRPEQNKSISISKGLFPAILAINFSLILCTNESIIDVVLTNSGDPNYIASFAVIFVYMIGIGYLIFTPIWFILDAGLVYSNIKDKNARSQPVEARTVGGWYLILFKGYAGIGTFISFYSFLSTLISIGNYSDVGAMIGLILIIGIPFFAMLGSLPAIMFLEAIKEKRNKFVRGFARKIGIKDEVEINFSIGQSGQIR